MARFAAKAKVRDRQTGEWVPQQVVPLTPAEESARDAEEAAEATKAESRDLDALVKRAVAVKAEIDAAASLKTDTPEAAAEEARLQTELDNIKAQIALRRT